MFRLAWATDIHLDHLPNIPDVAESFATYLVQDHDPNALLVTGDITLAPTLEYHLDQLEAGLLGLPLYFVLGNHDYYRGSFEESHTIASTHDGWLQKGFYHEGRLFKDHEWVVFATHYPPFKEACWHEGHMSNDLFLPWFTSKHMGDMLLEVAAAHPDRKILVLCGHSHSSGIYEALPNLHVYTGEAVYGAPDVAGILEIDDSGILVRMRINKHWTTIAPFLKRAPV